MSIDAPNQSSTGLCHCCLELTCQKSLWQTHEWMGSSEKYGEMLQECFSLDLSDQHNAKICEVCITQLRNAVRFRAQVVRCQKQLRMRERRDDKVDDRQDGPQSKSEQTSVIKIESSSDSDDPVEHYVYDESLQQLLPVNPDSSSDRSSSKIEVINDASTSSSETVEEVPVKLQKLSKTNTRVKGQKRIINIKKSAKVDRRTIAFQSTKYTKPRRNVGLLLEHSTICPFKFSQAYFKCFYCTKNFLVFEELRSHVKECHNNLVFKDIIKCITRPNDQIKVDASEIACRTCHKIFLNLEELVAHLRETHSIEFDENPADSLLPYDLADNKFKCVVCKAEFAFFKTLGKHMNEHASNHVCDVCGKCFLLIERLRMHVSLHSQVAMKCEHCDKMFPTKPALKSHVNYVHARKPFWCSICAESFPTYRKRLQHFVERHGRAPPSFQCQHCSKSFTANSTLKSHLKYHHLMVPKEAKYTCDDCGRKFYTKRVLNGHMLVHTGEKNYECEVCKKKFGRVFSLREHLKIHKNEKNWSCRACSVCFVQKCSLKNHIKVHHAEYNFADLVIHKNSK